MILLKGSDELAVMDRANALVLEVLRLVSQAAGPGRSTLELDELA